MVALALELQRRGHTPVISTSESYREKIVSTGVAFHATRPNLTPDDKDLLRAVMDERGGPEHVIRRLMVPAVREMYGDLMAAAQSAAGPDRGDTLLQGVEMVRRQFLAKLEGFGVKRIESEGQRFDPDLHEAVSAIPPPTPDQHGIVVGVIRHGYRIGDDVLRPASVAVAKSS